MFTRDKTKQIRIDKVTIGGGSPVAVQTMTNTQTADWKTTVAQIKKVEKAGADIVRVAVPDISAARVLGKIKKNIS
ncbi:MAG: flavodoxin-dependent (E)-4-hydroxy-3-methylbut-2-enyl-diphosphate synthase, partial [Elusimicrobiota bacterium]